MFRFYWDTWYNYDVIATSESQLRSSVENTEIHIEGFSHEVFRKDHPDDKCKGRDSIMWVLGQPLTSGPLRLSIFR